MEEKKKASVPVKPKKKSKKDICIIFLNILFAIITISLLGYIAYKNGYINLENILNIQEKKEESQEDETEEQEEQEEKEDISEKDLTLQTYEGTYFNAVMPLDWTIEEFFDGEGSVMMSTQTSYTGLTGILIKDGKEEIMKIEGVSGIGFVACPKLPRFKDSSSEYEKMQEEMGKEIGGEKIEYLDYTDTLYSEFTWLDKKVRRIGPVIYYDTVEGDKFFQPQCETFFIKLDTLGFKFDDGYEGDAYMYTISQEATEEELGILDKILISMVAI